MGVSETCLKIAAAFVAAMTMVTSIKAEAASPSVPAVPPTVPAPAATQPPAPSGDHPLERGDLEAWLDGMINYALKKGDIAGGVLSVVKDGNTLLQKGFGEADVGNHIPMDAERTMTRAGSTSKLFTWTAVMQLVQQGKLDLNKDINVYLDFKICGAGGKPITLIDLMNHRGGFEEGLKDIFATDPHGLQSTETYLKQHIRPMLFAPGAVPAYSNYGAALAGYIVERVSGEPFDRYVEHHIFTPLGMQHSTFEQPLPDRFKSAVSQGYKTASLPPQPYELIITRPAGSLTTTAADMARFMLAHLQGGRLAGAEMLNAETTRLMQSPSETGPPGFGTMAHGFFYEERNGHTLIGHGGDTVVFHTELDLLPKDGVGIFYSFNSRGRDGAVYSLRKAILDGFMDRYFPSATPRANPSSLPTAAHDAGQIAGRYQSSRRIEHGFMSLFYLLQQSVITAHADGTIGVPSAFGDGEETFHEVGANLWQQVGGTHQLALQATDQGKTVIDSEDPISVLQNVPFIRSAPLNLTILGASFTILAVAVIFWPISWFIRRRRGLDVTDTPQLRRLRLIMRAAAAFDLIYLIAWMMLLQPVLNLELQVYSTAFDPVVRALQWAGIVVIAAAAATIWSIWRRLKLEPISLMYRLRYGLLAFAMLGIVWIGFMGQLISFNLNY
jgi:CubicO group peptidase (beta-lactamase class C family)